jgi:G:T-mismatch repair DNA endonuclease (very short patch repair protein)
MNTKEFRERFPGISLVSEKTKLLDSKSHFGKKFSEETKNKISLKHKGKKLSSSHIQSIKESVIEFYRKEGRLVEKYKDRDEDLIVCPICGEKKLFLAPHIRKLHGLSTQETKKRFPGLVLWNRTFIKKTKLRMKEDNPAKRFSVREKISKRQIGREGWNKGLTKETDRRLARIALKISKAVKEKQWNNPNFDKKAWFEAVKKGQTRRPSGFEKLYMEFLESLGFKYTGDGSYWIENKNPDFTNLEEKKIIELFGTYFHKREDEEKVKDFYGSKGFRVLVVWDNEKKEDIVKKILEFRRA